MIDDDLDFRNITPDPLMLEAADRPPWLSRCWTGFRPVLAFPVRLLTAILANGTILVCGGIGIAISAVFLIGVVVLIIAALVLALLTMSLFGVTFGTTRIGDWISGTKTLAYLPKALREAADKVNIQEDIGNIRARAHARRNRGG